MPRVPRFVVPGLPHHVTQRGNYRQPVFFNDADRQFFLRRLIKRAKQYEIDVLAWCLMINHFHLIAIPRRRDSFALGLRALLGEYSLRINALRGDVRGHIWQSHFYSCALSQRHLRMALRYVELNPVRANLVDDPEQYPWSSARCHLGLAPPLGVGLAPGLCAPHEWASWLQAGASKDEEEQLRECTFSGRVFGTAAPKRGRPRKEGRSLISVPNLHIPDLGQ
jgi:putative transposase